MSHYPEASAEQIEAAKHSEEQYIELYRMYVQRVHRFVLSRTGDVHLAEDITQETFVSMLRKLTTYTPTGAPFSSWLFQIALNHIRMHMRKRSNQPNIDLEVIPEITQSAQDHTAEWLDVWQALHKLNDKDQELLIMKYIDGMSNQEIATVMQISTNGCGVKLHRALQRLQEYL